MKPEEAIRGLAEEARRIGKQHSDQASAWEKALKAKAEFLLAIIDAIRPALPAICSRVVLKKDAPDGRRGDQAATWTGVCVAGGLGDARALYLNSEGVLVEVDYIWGGGWEWEGKWCPLTVAHTVTEYEVEPIIDRLAQLLVAQARGSAPHRTAQLTAIAAKFEALTILLRGSR